MRDNVQSKSICRAEHPEREWKLTKGEIENSQINFGIK
jgi:hypothetical protein